MSVTSLGTNRASADLRQHTRFQFYFTLCDELKGHYFGDELKSHYFGVYQILT